MRLCKTPLSKRVWVRKLVRRLGFLIYPDYDIEDIEINVQKYHDVYQRYRVTSEDDCYYHVITEEGNVATLSKDVATRSNTFITGKVFYEKGFKGCYLVDSEEEWEKRLAESMTRVKGKR
jgi:hypothetical protein